MSTKWSDNLQTASWRGISFGVSATSVRRGRRLSVHEYPFKDGVWVEDLGRAKRELAFTAWLVGDDVIEQQARMIAACESKGSGDLIHPSLGRLTCALAGFEIGLRSDLGRVCEVTFSFIETSDPIYPDGKTSTRDTLRSLVAIAGKDVISDFQRIKAALIYGFTVVKQVSDTVNVICKEATEIIRNPLGAFLSYTVVSAGRYAYGAVNGAINAANTLATTFGEFGQNFLPSESAARAIAARSVIATQTASRSISVSDTKTFTTALQATTSAVRTSSASPQEAIRVLRLLADAAHPTSPVYTGGLGAWIRIADVEICALIRRLTCMEMASAVADYVPSSYDDAVAIREAVSAYFDLEITYAGDTGADRSYEALRVVRSALVADINTRGATLAPMIDVVQARPLPSLVIAYSLYNDATRSDEIIAEVTNTIHPAFMPTKMRVKNS